MAHATGVTCSPLMEDLLSRGHEFSFSQVMRLARRFLDPKGEQGLPEVPWQDRVNIRPELSLGFPAADVARVERDGDNLQITATFLELYGPASPLPNFFTEDLMDEASCDETVYRDFIDILHQRLYHLWFRCWGKYRLLIRIVEENNPIDRERLLCLIGLGERALADSIPEAYDLLRYTGILTQYPRSATGLATILRDALKMKTIRIVQNIKRMVPIPRDQRMCMGVSGCRLGVDTVLGSRIADRMGKIRIKIGPLSWEDFNESLPGTDRNEKLTRYTRFYLSDPLDVDLQLILAAGEAKPIRIGDPKARLGLNTWCFAGDSIGEVGAAFTVAANPFGKPASAPDPAPVKQERTLADYYHQERTTLGKLANRFTESHPNLAPLMSGPMADPGILRLLEGTAFFNALLQRKLDDDFPEFMHEVTRTLQPEHLRPVPATTIIAFTPKPNLTEPQVIPKGTELDSVPVDGSSCRFSTCYPVEIHPLSLVDVSFEHPSGKAARITLTLELKQISLASWRPNGMRFFLGGTYEHAADLFLLLTGYLSRIVVSPREEGGHVEFDPSDLKPVDLNDETALVPRSNLGCKGYHFIRDFFLLTEKCLFLELQGWEKWRERGDGACFTICFEFERIPFPMQRVTVDDFILFATPAINIFSHRAEPIVLDEVESSYSIIPASGDPDGYEVYSIEKVVGIVGGSAQRVPFIPAGKYESRLCELPMYCLTQNISVTREGLDTFITVKIPSDMRKNQIARISADLLCTNGFLPEKLGLGDIRIQTGNSPGFATFTNCKPINKGALHVLNDNYLWRYFSMNVTNPRMITAKILRALLKLILASCVNDWSRSALNEKRISGIADMKIRMSGRIINGAWRQGWDIRITLDSDRFCSNGDRYLFGMVLDNFLRGFVSETYFSRLIIEDVVDGAEYEWPARMGRKQGI